MQPKADMEFFMDENQASKKSFSGEERESLQRRIREYENMLSRITDPLIAIDKDWNITYINDPMSKIFMPGTVLKEVNFWERFKFLRGTDIEANFRNTMLNKIPASFIHHGIYAGEKKWLKLYVYPSDEGITVYILDYTDTFHKEEKLLNLVQERELLIKETHHRVKNNIQLIISLVHLQAVTAIEETRKELFSLQNRIGSFALLHELLYKTGSLASLDIKDYLLNLIKQIRKTYFDNDVEIEFELDIDSFEMETSKAISIGLLVNELVTNALKYAFSEVNTGMIKISFKQEAGYKELIVSDNGKGLPPEFNIDDLSSLGIRLVSSLTVQLDGTIKVHSNPGTTFIIRFE